jgi:hypothetical protein
MIGNDRCIFAANSKIVEAILLSFPIQIIGFGYFHHNRSVVTVRIGAWQLDETAAFAFKRTDKSEKFFSGYFLPIRSRAVVGLVFPN